MRHPRARREGGWSALTNALIGAFAGLLVLVALWSAWSASSVGAVEEWATWTSRSQPVSLRHPRGWRSGEFGEGGLTHAYFVRSAWVRVHLIAGPEVARLAYPAGAANGDVYATLERAHAAAQEQWRRQLFGEMREGRVARTLLGARPAVWSEFHYDSGMVEARGEPMAGYRATLLGAGTGVVIAAVAPERAWREFQPIALDVIRSVRLGPAAGAQP